MLYDCWYYSLESAIIVYIFGGGENRVFGAGKAQSRGRLPFLLNKRVNIMHFNKAYTKKKIRKKY